MSVKDVQAFLSVPGVGVMADGVDVVVDLVYGAPELHTHTGAQPGSEIKESCGQPVQLVQACLHNLREGGNEKKATKVSP